MKKLLLIFSVTLLMLRLVAGETVADKPLFNGTNLAGWTSMNAGSFSVTNGMIRVEGGKGWLSTDRVFTNFIFEVEGRGLETNYNSGIFIRASREGNPWATNVWQINFKQSTMGELLEGSKKIITVTNRLQAVGEWIKFHIEVRGSAMSLDVDGQRAWKFTTFPPAEGFIGLQAEGKTVEFRNLLIQPLP